MKKLRMLILIAMVVCGGYFFLPFYPPANPKFERIAFTRKASITGLLPYIGFLHRGIYVMNVDTPGLTHLTNTNNAFTWSPGGKQIAYYDYDTRNLYVIKPNGSNQPELLHSDIPYVIELTWSPDGTQIAYSDGEGMIYLLDLATKETKPLLSNRFDGTAFFCWSPDSTQIAFELNAFSDKSSIAVVNVDGSGLTQLTPDDKSRFPAWSPDGKEIVFNQAANIYVMNPDGTQVKALTDDGQSRYPTWSPDSTRIAFVSSGDDKSMQPALSFNGKRLMFNRTLNIYVMNRDGTEVKALTHDGDSWYPTWSPDGTRIAFLSSGGKDEVCDESDILGEIGDCTNQLRVMNSDGSNVIILRNGTEHLSSLTWSPLPQ